MGDMTEWVKYMGGNDAGQNVVGVLVLGEMHWVKRPATQRKGSQKY